MPQADDQRDTIAFLADPKTYGVGAVERIATHGSIVFLAGPFAYKLKRAVQYLYMDYSTAARRRAMCAREVAINRRTAPQLYRGTRDIVRDNGGALHFAPAGSAGAIDAVVVMTRFDQGQLLSRICAQGHADAALMRRTAEALVRFHAGAEPTPGWGGAAAIRAVIEENLSLFRKMAGAPFDAAAVEAYGAACMDAFARIAPLLDARAARGKVRQCHGDLHLNNIVLLDSEPVAFDAIEFDDAFARIDTLYDFAFLVMDLERIGAPALAHALFNRYLELAPDDEGLAALPLFLSLRAAIRAHVAVSRAHGADDADGFSQARTCFALAQKYLTPPPPQLVAVAGVSGTGKTTLARALAPRIGAAPGALILRSDIVRKQLLGAAETARLPESAYTPQMNARVFAQLAARADAILASGHSAVMDAVYGRQGEREEIAALAAKHDANFMGLWLNAPRNVLIERIAGREGDASDATVPVLDRQLANITPPKTWKVVDASGTPAQIAAAAAQCLKLEDG